MMTEDHSISMASLRGPYSLTGESDLRPGQINHRASPGETASASHSSIGISASGSAGAALSIPSPPHASLADISPALAAQLGRRAASMIGPSASYLDTNYANSGSRSNAAQLDYNAFMQDLANGGAIATTTTTTGNGAPSPQQILEAAHAAGPYNAYYAASAVSGVEGGSPVHPDSTFSYSSRGSYPSPASGTDLSYMTGAGGVDTSQYGIAAETLSPEDYYTNSYFPQQHPSPIPQAITSPPSTSSGAMMQHPPLSNNATTSDPSAAGAFSFNRYKTQLSSLSNEQPQPTITATPQPVTDPFSFNRYKTQLSGLSSNNMMDGAPKRQSVGYSHAAPYPQQTRLRDHPPSTASASPSTSTLTTGPTTTTQHHRHPHPHHPHQQMQQHTYNRHGQSGASQGVGVGAQVPLVKPPTAIKQRKVVARPTPYSKPSLAPHATSSSSSAAAATAAAIAAGAAPRTGGAMAGGGGAGPSRMSALHPSSLGVGGAGGSTSTANFAAAAAYAAAGGLQKTGLKPRGACSNCKRLKMKCVPLEPDRCKRCHDSNKECLVEGRKQRPPINKREELMAKLRDKDALIETLLRQLHNPNFQTPLSVSPSRIPPSVSSVSPEERVNKDILAWIEKAQASVRAQNLAHGEDQAAYRLDTRAYLDQESSDSGSDSGSLLDDDDMDGGGEDLSPRDANSPGASRRPAKRRAGSSSPKLHSLPEKSTPVGLLAHLSLEEPRARTGRSQGGRSIGQLSSGGEFATDGEDRGEEEVRGPADPEYYRPGPAANPDLRRIIIERQMAPEILTSGLISSDEVEKLFGIFFDKLNVFLSILDPVIHTPATIFGRCPFLFTVICAISARYYTERPDLYPIAMHFAKTAAASTLIDGWKSVELCQAYILLAVYPVQARRWEEDRTWLYLGLAIRMATDLNLHQPTTTKIINEQHEREILNRTRTWLICFNLDRSSSAQLGKPTTIREDWIIRNSKDWWKRSKYNFKMDIHLCTYSSLLRIMARFQEVAYSDPNSPTGIQTKLDYRNVTFSFDEELATYKAETAAKFAVHSDQKDPVCVYRAELMPFLVNYSRLVILSFGFQQAYQKGLSPSDDVVVRCLDAASSVVKIMADSLAPKGFLRYAPDGHFVFAAFASAFLIKMLRLEFKSLLDDDQRQRVIQLVSRLIKVLSSPEVAIDERHTPKLYAKFLAGLLNKYVICPEAEKEKEKELDKGKGKAKSPSLPAMNGAAMTRNGYLAAPGANVRPPVNGRSNTIAAGMSQAHLHQHQAGTSTPHPPIEIVPPRPGDSTYEYHPDHDTGLQQPAHQASYQQHADTDMSAVNGGFTHTLGLPLTQPPPGPHILSPDSTTLHGNSPLSIDDFLSSGDGGGSTVQGADTETVFTMDYVGPASDDDMLAAMYAVAPTSTFWTHMMTPGFAWPADDAPMPWEMQLDSDSMGVPSVMFGGSNLPI